MFGTQVKIIRHIMRQEDTMHNEDDSQSIETDLGLNQYLNWKTMTLKYLLNCPPDVQKVTWRHGIHNRCPNLNSRDEKYNIYSVKSTG